MKHSLLIFLLLLSFSSYACKGGNNELRLEISRAFLSTLVQHKVCKNLSDCWAEQHLYESSCAKNNGVTISTYSIVDPELLSLLTDNLLHTYKKHDKKFPMKFKAHTSAKSFFYNKKLFVIELAHIR